MKEITYEFRIDGVAVPQGRPRATLRNKKSVAQGAAPIIGAYDPKTSRQWKNAVKKALDKQALLAEPLDGPLAIDLTFYLPKPKSKPKGKKYPDVRPDLDNFVKLIMDCANERLFTDDGRIVEIHARKLYCSWQTEEEAFETEPHVLLSLRTLPEPKKGRLC